MPDYSYNPNETLAAAESKDGRFDYSYVEGAPNLLASVKGPVAHTTYGYEENRNLVTDVHNQLNEADKTVSQFAYTNDATGRRSSVKISGPHAENPGWDWGYNDRSELLRAEPKLKTENLKLHTYSYDDLGNRETATEGDITTAYQSNALNQYTAIEQAKRERIAPEYDLDGNLIEDENATYIWNANNRLVRVEKKSGVVATYQYDYMGRRTRKTVRQHDGSTTQSEFVYDGWNVIQESITSKGKEQSTKHSATRYYTWGRDLSGTLQGAGGVGGLLSIRIVNDDDSESELLYPTYDANGNITEVVDGNGKVKAAFQYGPFGNLISEKGALAEQIPFRFSTKYFDGETGFYYYGYRFYVQNRGRWLSTDPSHETGGPNRYAFLSNKGINATDYLGLFFNGNSYSSDLYGAGGDIFDRISWNVGRVIAEGQGGKDFSFIHMAGVGQIAPGDGVIPGGLGPLAYKAMRISDGRETPPKSKSGVPLWEIDSEPEQGYLANQIERYSSLPGTSLSFREVVAIELHQQFGNIVGGKYNFSVLNKHYRFDDHTDGYRAFGHADIRTEGIVCITNGGASLLYVATVVLTDHWNFLDPDYLKYTREWLKPTGIGYRLQEQGWIRDFRTEGRYEDIWRIVGGIYQRRPWE